MISPETYSSEDHCRLRFCIPKKSTMADSNPNPESFPTVSYIMNEPHSVYEVENPLVWKNELAEKMPHLENPKPIAGMVRAITDIVQSRSMLEKLGPRLDHEAVDSVKLRLAEIEANNSGELNNDAEAYEAVILMDEMHEAYERMLGEAERKLERPNEKEEGKTPEKEEEEFDKEVIRVLKEGIQRVDLSRMELRSFPEAIGKLNSTLVVLNLSRNYLQAIPDSIAGLENLVELNLSENRIQSLSDSIGLMFKLKILDVSGNKLSFLPDGISHCRSLVELNASFNSLTYLPTDIGFELVYLNRLDIHLNKIRFLPTSIGEMKSLRFLDVHFNALQGLPTSIGRLTNLEVLNLSSNFNDLTKLPNTLCDVISLKELDLSHNQIRALPDTFAQLVNLTKLNLEHNPLVLPPKEVVAAGVEAVRAYMAERWTGILMEEEQKAIQAQEHTEANVFIRFLTNATSAISGYFGSKGKSDTDPCLDQLL